MGQSRQNSIEYALLGFLRQRPSHGYEIYQRLNEPWGLVQVWHIKQSQMYALLAKLEDQGYVTTTLEPQEARPPRKILHLTEAGRAAFQEWLETAVPHGRQIRLEFLVKLYFAWQEGNVATLLANQRTTCRRWLADQQQALQSLASDQVYERLVGEFRLGQIEAILDWLEACERTLSERPLSQ